MTTYDSYAEAKIANPDQDIYKLDKSGSFTFSDTRGAERLRFLELNDSGTICNPADHCMTVEKFLADGHKFVEGDLILDEGSVYLVADCKSQSNWYETESANMPDCDDDRRFTLRAAALEEEPELTKENSPQGVISRISNRLHNMGCEHQDSELGEELSGMACEIWGVLPMISNEEPKQEKPKRVKVSYVQEKSFKEVLKCAIDGESFYSKGGNGEFKFDASRLLFVNHNGADVDISRLTEHCFYRKVETEIDERQEFIDEIPKPDFEGWFWEVDSVDRKNEYRLGVKGKLATLFNEHLKVIVDSGKFKLVNAD